MVKKKNGFRQIYTIGFLLLLLSPMGITPIETWSSLFSSLFLEANAQEFEEYTIRNATSVTTMYSETRGSTTMGLPLHVEDNQGNFVANLFIEDSNGIQLESGTVSYYYDKASCGMTQFEKGRIISGETSPIIQSNSWGVKVAVNGTDNWSDISQNSLPCEVSTTVDGDMITLNSTRSDSEGTITEIWDYTKYGGLKQTIFFTNDDASLNDHKFHFSNIMDDTPKSFTLQSWNGTGNSIQTNSYSVYSSDFQPSLLGSAQVLNTSVGETIQFDYDDLFFVNGTEVTTITDSFTWIDKDQGLVGYQFDLGIDKLWAVKFIANTDNTIDVYVDYANVNQPLAVGSTMMLDPTVNPPETDYMRVSSSTAIAASSFCGVGWASASIDGAFSAVITGNAESCSTPVWKYDITDIPDTATPVSMTFTLNATANTNSAPAGFIGGGDIRVISAEDIFQASTTDIGDVIYNEGNGGAGDILSSVHFDLGNWFVTAGTYVGVHAVTQNNPSTATNQFEVILESGSNFIIYVGCRNPTGSCAHSTNFSGSASMTFEPTETFLTVEWEQFTVSDAPEPPITATYSASPDTCTVDWNFPLNNGGRPITGYQVSRNTGAGFQIIVADTGGSLPTEHDDTTITAGISNTYTVAVITLEGVGAESIVSNGCGVPEIPSAPFGLIAQNAALGIVGLDWEAPFFDGNSPITGYNVTRLNATSFVTILDGDTGTSLREFLDNTVDVETQYGYRVAAINIIGTSPFSNTAIIVTVGLPPPPSNVQATATGTSTIDLSWTAPDVGSTTITGYQIDRKETFSGIFTTIDPFTGNDDTTFNDALLTAGIEFCYQLKTFTNIGQSVDFSVENQATTCATTQDQSDPPDNLVATAIDGSSINVTWDTPIDDGGSTITGYKIERQKGANPFLILFTERQPESNRVLLDTGLEVGTQYTYRITAITGFGEGESGTASDTTDATPQAPPNFSCSAGSTTSITLNWDIPITFSAPTGYQIDRRTVGGGFSTLVADTGNTDTFFVDSGLPVDSIFEYQILAHTPEGDTDFTPTITCATLGAPDNFPPEDLQGDFTATVPHQMVLAWDIPDTFGIPITEFRIERDDGVGFNQIATVSGSTFVFVDQDPDNDVDQSYRIFTVGSEGDSVPSTAIPFPTNQTSHWNYEKTVDDTGDNKNSGTIFGTANFNGTGHVGKAFIFNNTRIEVDPSQESDYDFDNSTSFGITSYYKAQAGATIPAFDDEWEIREQEINVSLTVNCNFNITPPFSIDMTLNTGVGFCHVFKVFDKADIVGKILNVTWAGTGSSADMRTRVYDGSYDRDTASDFPLTTGTNGFTAVLKGGGVLHAIDRTVVFSSVTDSVNMTMAGSTESQVTIAISLRDPSNTLNQFMDLTEIEIVGLETWTWDSSASRTMEVTGTQNDKGFSNANFTQNTFVGTDQIIVSKAQTLTDTGYKFYVDKNGKPSIKLTNTDSTNEIFVQATTDVADDTLHFIGFGYNGNGTASGISMNIDGSSVTPSIITDTLTDSILNNEALNIGGTSTGTNLLIDTTIDETRIFGSGTLDEDSLDEVANDEIQTMIPINATITIAGATFADISSETPLIIMTSGYPLPTINTIDLFNFTATNVNSQAVGLIIDGVSGQFILDPSLFNIMGSLSNYTATTSLTNSEETFPLLSNFDLQTPLFTFTGDFFFQQQRNPTFDILSFNYTQTLIPFDLDCNFKSTLFGNGTTVEFDDVFFVAHLEPVEPVLDVVVACIDPNQPIVDPLAPSFGGINTILSFVSFGDTTGVGNFIQFTNNYGDFFGIGLPFLFVIILAAAFTGRSAPTGILIIAVSIGIMAAMGILEVDPFMWGIILVLVILGVLGGKKFL